MSFTSGADANALGRAARDVRLAVVIPALNEAGSIECVVRAVGTLADRVYVVDDGSTDATSSIASDAGAVVLRNERPQGYDAAIASGLNRAFADGARSVVTCDADGQHRAADIATVAALVTQGGNDFATGLRDRYNRPVEALAGLLSRLLFGSWDPFCGLKCYSSSLHRHLGRFPDDMHVGTLPLLWVRQFKLRAQFVGISVERRADRARFGERMSANLKLVRAFAATARGYRR